MRTREEIDHAHTLLLIAQEIAIFPNEFDAGRAQAALTALCWVLGHNHECIFADLIEELDRNITYAPITGDKCSAKISVIEVPTKEVIQ